MAEHVTISGDHATFGEQLGQLKKWEINQVLNTFKSTQLFHEIQELLTTARGQRVLQQFKDTANQYCAEYVAELHGLAIGACVSFDDLFQLNIDCESQAILEVLPGHTHGVRFPSSNDGCTNLSLETMTGQAYFVHTEDVRPDWVQYGLMITARISANIPEEWTDYVIPGILPGSKFGFNKHGLMFGHNNVNQNGCNERGIPRRLMCRSLLRCSNVNEVRHELLQEPGIATAYTLHITTNLNGQNRQGTISSTVIEVAGNDFGTVSAEFEPSGFYFHCNVFQHLRHECQPQESSIHRAAAISQYVNRGQTNTLEDLKTIISDISDKRFPVYRTGITPDYLATAATGIFDCKDMKLYVYTDQPARSKAVHVFHVPHHASSLGDPSLFNLAGQGIYPEL